MKLDDEQRQKVVKKLSEKWGPGRTCPVCHSQEWTILDKVVEIREFYGGHTLAGGPLIPLVVATCNNCGNTLFFNAIFLDIVKPEIKEAAND